MTRKFLVCAEDIFDYIMATTPSVSEDILLAEEDFSSLELGNPRSTNRPSPGFYFPILLKEKRGVCVLETEAFFSSGFVRSKFGQATLYVPYLCAPKVKDSLQKVMNQLHISLKEKAEAVKNVSQGATDAQEMMKKFLDSDCAEVLFKAIHSAGEGYFLNFEKEALLFRVNNGRMVAESVGDLLEKGLPASGLYKCRMRLNGVFACKYIIFL